MEACGVFLAGDGREFEMAENLGFMSIILQEFEFEFQLLEEISFQGTGI